MARRSAGRSRKRARIMQAGTAALVTTAALSAGPIVAAHASNNQGQNHNSQGQGRFVPGSVVVSGTVFPRDGVNLSVGQNLPYATNYGATVPEPGPVDAQAVANGQYPYVFNNDNADGSFAVATPIDLWDISPGGSELSTVHVPTDEMTTSFSSKSELAVNVSTNGHDLSLLGYNAPVGSFDPSNSNTPGIIDPTNPDLAGPYFRVAGDLSSQGKWSFTETNSYTGDNGRAAVLDNADGQFFAAGNDNNGSLGKKGAPAIPTSMIDATGAQTFPRSTASESSQTAAGGDAAGLLGTFSINWLPAYTTATDKPGKDTNFRGLTVYNNVVYYTKGSGSNGVNTVYFVDTSGTACSHTNAVGIPTPGAQLPAPGVTYNMCILRGFNTEAAATDTNDFPFGIWFANSHTMYVADEGDGNISESATNSNPYADAQSEQYAGLQKWVFNTSTQSWQRAYTLQNGLDLG